MATTPEGRKAVAARIRKLKGHREYIKAIEEIAGVRGDDARRVWGYMGFSMLTNQGVEALLDMVLSETQGESTVGYARNDAIDILRRQKTLDELGDYVGWVYDNDGFDALTPFALRKIAVWQIEEDWENV